MKKQYIDKSALIAKVEKRIEETKGMQPKFDQFWAGQISAFKGVLKILNTLEVKEVDVEKESELIANSIMISVQANLYHTNVYDYEKRCYKHSDLKDAARKGIELGLKAQKGE